MTMLDDRFEMQRISSEVQAALDRHQPRAYRITVEPEAVRRDGSWYQVVVVSPDDIRDRDFYDALAGAEADLQDRDGRNYLLVPALSE